MRQRLIALFLAACGLMGLLAGQVFAVDASGRLFAPSGEASLPAAVCNSDTEAAMDGSCWYVDTMAGGLLMRSRFAEQAITCTELYDLDPEITPLSDWPAEQLLYWQGRLLVSAAERLLWLDPETGEILDSRSFSAPVARFAMSADGLYVLTGGCVLRLGAEEETIRTGVTDFWLQDADTLCYLRDEAAVHSLRLSTGAETEQPNLRSDLGDVPIYGAEQATRAAGVSTLKQKFPHGKYWNHMPNRGTGMSYNNQNGWTNQACYKHNNYCGTYMQTCNGYAPNGKELSYQCWGFADKLGYDASGRDPQSLNQSYGWKQLWYSSSLDSLKAGDIVRYNKNGSSSYAHSIYVTAVSGNTVTYADCNYDGTCVIRWGQTIAKTTLRSWFVFLLSAPAAVAENPTYQIEVKARLDGADAASCKGLASFDVWINGAAAKTGVSEFKGSYVSGTKYEIKNVKAAEGILFDGAGSTGLSGTLSGNLQSVLCFDHYYLNSKGEAVKTRLTDLPTQSSWSYVPICWALENGITAGVSETRFSPKGDCTRAQILSFLWVASGRPDAEAQTLPFTDVKSGAYYYRAVLWAVEQGITSGKTETRFAPNDVCTRAEVVSFLWCLAGRPEPTVPEQSDGDAPYLPFTDVRQSAYYYRPVLWAVEHGITAGTSATIFSPHKTCTREETLTFLYRYYTER